VACHGRAWAEELARLTGGTFVELGREEDAGRVVLGGETLDFSSFRNGAVTIEQELVKRDLTVNGLGLCIDSLIRRTGCDRGATLTVIDPQGGVQDLASGLIRLCSIRSLVDDPLRLLRVFRFAAVLGFAIAAETMDAVRIHKSLITAVAPERIAHELDLIMASDRAHQSVALMAETGLLFEIMPELLAGVGMEQPASHHLDVFDHLLETLRQMERIQRDPGRFFPGHASAMMSWLDRGHHCRLLKWVAFLHDVGKPATYGINEDKGGRITFYNHDQEGVALFAAFAERLRWSGADIRVVSLLIGAHMRPFFLANDQRRGEVSLKACLRLLRKVGDDLPGLFMLAMADALAGKGEGSPEKMEQEVAALFGRLLQVWRQHVVPVRTAKPLLTGRDLIDKLGLTPGPQFKKILARVEEAQMEHRISTHAQALALAAEYSAGDRK
ncbi:MAG TPA: HD domain-containing protein, partial [Desulfobulbaceae bacterium]|nr:HD domain-containing protein [Desulfobulbaceae bacterium]